MLTITRRPDAVDCYHGTDLTDAFVHGLAAAGVQLFIHKCSQGASMRDPLFASRMARVAAYNASGEGFIARAAYHGLNDDDPATQVANMLAAIKGQGPFIPVLDVEKLGSDTMPRPVTVKAAIAVFRGEVGHHPMLYGSDPLRQTLAQLDPDDWQGCLLWLAGYPYDPTWAPHVMHQYDEYGTLDGVSTEAGTLDLSTFTAPGALQTMRAYEVSP